MYPQEASPMPRICSVFSHKERPRIEAAVVAAETYRDITGKFAAPKSANPDLAVGDHPNAT